MRHSQNGITLLELVIALGLMAGVMTGLYQLVDTFNQNTRTAVVSQHMSTVGQAAQAYIKDNYSAVSAVATATTPALIRVSTLSGANYLQSGYSVSNTYNQNVCVLVLQPVANQLAALVVAEGGTAIDDLSLGQIAALMGAAGGGVYSSATTTLKGAMGGWSTGVGNFANANAAGLHCDGTAGAVSIAAGHPIMALWFAGGDVTSGFLYRNAVAGHPELNQMQTALDMNSNAITNAATVALNTVVTTGAACATNGVVARDTNGAVMSCQSATWQPQGSAFWKDPVANAAALPTCNAGAAWQTRVVQTPTTGSGPRAYTCNGTTWQPLAVDDSGNITIAGTATINNLAGNLTITPTAAVGAACTPNGRLAQDGTGLLLTCVSAVWTKVSGSGYTQSQMNKARSLEGTLSCGTSIGYPTSSSGHYAYYTAAGQPYVRVTGSYGLGSCDSGWVAGTSVTMTDGSCGWYYFGSLSISTSINTSTGISGSWNYPGFNGATGCGAAWPKVYSQLYGPE
ncbi:MAG: shufflon system plasmid conjugative transfer pilus tip adhesin PilV [Sulfuritalea sp.]|nr:shufflon system plasmid conjugative transfer pilus tip adhesin PilV [Sulfuritalea sp.]